MSSATFREDELCDCPIECETLSYQLLVSSRKLDEATTCTRPEVQQFITNVSKAFVLLTDLIVYILL